MLVVLLMSVLVIICEFTTAMPDSNYSLIGTSDDNAGLISTFNGTYNTTTAKVMGSITITGGASDLSRITVAIFR